ncbi:MAG: hypothetical protein LUH19_06995, partial [Lachnospiraceae bacterium]|nr:hypothetical protein [Lachnospiraceae bacterium]
KEVNPDLEYFAFYNYRVMSLPLYGTNSFEEIVSNFSTYGIARLSKVMNYRVFCPNCGGPVFKTNNGLYGCANRCGMMVGYFKSEFLNSQEIGQLLAGHPVKHCSKQKENFLILPQFASPGYNSNPGKMKYYRWKIKKIDET